MIHFDEKKQGCYLAIVLMLATLGTYLPYGTPLFYLCTFIGCLFMLLFLAWPIVMLWMLVTVMTRKQFNYFILIILAIIVYWIGH